MPAKGSKTRGSCFETALEHLRRRILTGSARGGDPLSELQVARDLGMSRTPVRAALRRLAEEGFVTLVPQRGFFVNACSVQDYKEVNDIRSVLEPLALETALPCLPGEFLEAQRRLWKGHEEALERGGRMDRDALVRDDEAFHALLVEHCRNERLKGFLRILRAQIAQIRLSSWMAAPVYVAAAVRQHLELLDRMEEGNLGEAQELLRRHILLKQAYLSSYLG
ncbi:GntR family transcriptional regulator [Aminomonas paucivorans]|uniref:Transcriptional regulator, GntR family n=1 Tax=Aminomonas paucivorans DSM 12260 TaxID=584708 RepID=E3CWR3_9BACT|nr:GntR family transcriptional regulator [Aminomonas paucivorans]EFQ22568.1 transcriptional regulator, GntR family [Aminomonas paucivorans DSM 12260]